MPERDPLELAPCLTYGLSEDIEGVGEVGCVLVLVPSLPLATMRLSSIETDARGDFSPEVEAEGFPSICFDCQGSKLSVRRHSTHSLVYLHLTANTFLSVGMSSTSCHSLIVTLHTVDALTRLGKDEL